jgi:hypothetical protein
MVSQPKKPGTNNISLQQNCVLANPDWSWNGMVTYLIEVLNFIHLLCFIILNQRLSDTRNAGIWGYGLKWRYALIEWAVQEHQTRPFYLELADVPKFCRKSACLVRQGAAKANHVFWYMHPPLRALHHRQGCK